MLLKDFVQSGVEALCALYPPGEARSIVSLLCEGRLGVQSYTHIIEPGRELPEDVMPVLRADMERLLRSEPVQYVLGRTEFCGHTFRVAPGVLIPRPETEMLTQMVLEDCPAGARVLDLCTGSGCIAWSLAMARPGLLVTGVDISSAALQYARAQDFPGESLPGGLVPPVFVQADVLGGDCSAFASEYDIIVSNPPYVMPSQAGQMERNVLDYEPSEAIFAPSGDPLAFYRAIAELSRGLLSSGGRLLLEINDRLAAESSGIFEASGYRDVKIFRALDGLQRFISCVK